MRRAVGDTIQRQRGGTADGEPLAVPVEGWDAISPLAMMKPTRAVQLDNFFPQPGYLELRRGSTEHADTETSDPVESVMAYHGLTTTKLFAATADTIWDVTSTGPATDDVTGLANGRWQHVNFAGTGGNFLWIANGADPPQYYNGTSWAETVITGVAPESIVSVTVFKSRLWLCVNGSLNPWYLPVDSIQGAAVEFPLDSVFSKGGFLMAIGSWNVDGGDGPDDLIAFVTSRGQVAVYGGSDPGANFSIKGVFEMGTPIGRRCLTKIGPDLAIITIDGVLPMSRAFATERGAALSIAITQVIQPVVNQSARDHAAKFGWQLLSYPRGTRAILNVPISESALQYQYVMNTVTGAWCRFIGQSGGAWEVFNDRLFYGGNDGKVYEADVGGNDAGSPITANLRCAFNHTRAPGRLKAWKLARANLTTNGIVVPSFALNVDYEEDAALSLNASTFPPGALWDTAIWDQDLWAVERRIVTDWLGIVGVGNVASLRMQVAVNVQDAPVLQVNAFDWIYEAGGWM